MPADRFRRLFRLAVREPSVGQDVDEEIRTHLAQLADWLVAQGWKPDAARDEARRRFGDLDRFRRELRTIDGGARRRRRLGERLDSWRQDLSYAVRGLRRSPGYAAVIVGTLGLALGANATMFGVVDRLLLRPPPGVGDPDQVRRVEVARWQEGHLTEPWDAISFPSYEALRDRTSSFRQVAAVTGATLSLGLGDQAQPARAVLASGQYFALLEARPALGRFFGPAEDRDSGERVAVLSHAFWETAFGADSAVVGRSLLLNGAPFQVIGVAARRFVGSDLDPVDVWVPLTAGGALTYHEDDWRTGRGWQFLNALVRVKPGVSDQQAADDARRAYQLANADFAPFEARAVPSFRRLQDHDEAATSERVSAWLYGVTILVLLIACANIANVVLARGLVRRTETAVRQALGVSGRRLLRQYAVETALVVGLGLAVGLALTRWGGALVRRVLLSQTSWDADPVNGRVLLATGAAAAVAAFLASLWPLVRSARVDLAQALHGAGRSAGGIDPRVRNGLLLVQTTLSTALVIAAGLFLRSMSAIRSLDLGIDPAGVALVSVDLDGLGARPAEVRAFYEDALARIRRLPEVAAAGLSVGAPFLGNQGRGIRVPGLDSIPRLAGGGPYYFPVSAGALEAFGATIVAGRSFTDADREGSLPVAIVSERTARTLWPGRPALGRCFYPSRDSTAACHQVVGITREIHRQQLDEAAQPFLLFFSPLDQDPGHPTPQHLVVRTRGDEGEAARAIRRTLAAARADLPYVRIRWYRDILTAQSRPWSLGATLFSAFGLLSLIIAAIGLYGVIAFAVAQRTREIGLRAALGASPRRLLRSVVLSGVGVAGLGVLLGIGLVLFASGRLETLLFHTRGTDPLVFGAAVLVVLGVSGAASWVPARRAARVDPMEALRTE